MVTGAQAVLSCFRQPLARSCMPPKSQTPLQPGSLGLRFSRLWHCSRERFWCKADRDKAKPYRQKLAGSSR